MRKLSRKRKAGFENYTKRKDYNNNNVKGNQLSNEQVIFGQCLNNKSCQTDILRVDVGCQTEGLLNSGYNFKIFCFYKKNFTS